MKDTKKKEKTKAKSRPKTLKTAKARVKPVNTLKATIKTVKSAKSRPKNDSRFKRVEPKIKRKTESDKPVGAKNRDKWILEKLLDNPDVLDTRVNSMRNIKTEKEKKMLTKGAINFGEPIKGNISDVPMPSLQNNKCGTFGCGKKAMRGKAYCSDCTKEVELFGHTVPKRRKETKDFAYDREQEEIEI
jgi:hypothetical protein